MRYYLLRHMLFPHGQEASTRRRIELYPSSTSAPHLGTAMMREPRSTRLIDPHYKDRAFARSSRCPSRVGGEAPTILRGVKSSVYSAKRPIGEPGSPQTRRPVINGGEGPSNSMGVLSKWGWLINQLAGEKRSASSPGDCYALSSG